jgi:hypothetical protein
MLAGLKKFGEEIGLRKKKPKKAVKLAGKAFESREAAAATSIANAYRGRQARKQLSYKKKGHSADDRLIAAMTNAWPQGEEKPPIVNPSGPLGRAANSIAASLTRSANRMRSSVTAAPSKGLRKAIEETEAELGGDASALVKEAKKLLRRVEAEEALTNAIEKKPVDVSALEAALEAAKEHIPGTSAVAKRASVMLEKVMSERGSDGIVSPPTPDHLWWEPEKGWPDRGWPRTSYYWRPEAMRSGVGECPPKECTPTTEQTPCRMPLPTEVLGTLYVEVLEADGLRQTDLLSHSDPYALVLFEGFAAITVWVNNTLKPRWPHDSARAFKLPVTHPNSDLRVALFDHDDGIVDDDDKLGRVVISLGGMYPRTEYDAWFPLQRKATQHHLKRHGRVRLRYRLEWKHERAALLHAAAAPPAFKIPFTTPLYAKAAYFAIHGEDPEHEYDLSTLISLANEAKRYGLALLEELGPKLLELCQWRKPHHSAILQLAVQLLCWRPYYIPAAIMACYAAALAATYKGRKGRKARKLRKARKELGLKTHDSNLYPLICAKLPFTSVMRTLLYKAPLPQLTCENKWVKHGRLPPAEDSSDDEEEEARKAEEAAKEAAAIAAREGSFEKEIEKIREEEEDLAEGKQSAQELSLSPRVHSWVAEQRRDRKASTAPTMFIAQGKQVAEKLVDKIQDRAAMLNPIGWALRPVHQYTYQALVYIRIAVRLVSWDDSVQTSLAAAALAATAVFLWFIGPWIPLFVRVSLHLGIAYALGPYNPLVKMADKAEKHAARAAAFEAATPVAKMVLLKEERVEIRREIAARELAEEKAEIKRRLTMSKAMQERERAKRRLERDAANMVTHEGHRTPEGPFGETRPDARIAAAKPTLSAEEVAAKEAAEAAAAEAQSEQDLRTMSGRRRPATPGKVQLLVPSEREAKGKLVVQLRDGSGLRAADKAKLGREASSDPYAARAILWPAIRGDSHVSRPATPLSLPQWPVRAPCPPAALARSRALLRRPPPSIPSLQVRQIQARRHVAQVEGDQAVARARLEGRALRVQGHDRLARAGDAPGGGVRSRRHVVQRLVGRGEGAARRAAAPRPQRGAHAIPQGRGDEAPPRGDGPRADRPLVGRLEAAPGQTGAHAPCTMKFSV